MAQAYGSELASRVRDDLLHLAPDLLRWHLPRVGPDGLLRPGLTIALARYRAERSWGAAGSIDLVVRTAPAWADSGQRVSLALWGGARTAPGLHPHPRPDRRFRLDLHRHLWDARRTGELRTRAGADPADPAAFAPDFLDAVPAAGCAIDRWADEARILLEYEGRQENTFLVRLGGRQRVIAELADSELRLVTGYPVGALSALPMLPDAATWTLPDLELLRTGVLSAGQLHPLVAAALAPDAVRDESDWKNTGVGRPELVDCRGELHRLGLVDGVLSALDHDPAEIHREELLAALTGTPVPCLQVIDQAHRHPDCLTGVRERLAHGDTAGALTIIDNLLGPAAALRDGTLRDELEAVAEQRNIYGRFRSGPHEPALVPPPRTAEARRARARRTHRGRDRRNASPS
ncbi:hypothetical protein AB0C65_16465 [Nocardia sp. NPDC048505]|uniref:hypothetical protein n=1 Tax=Nocardia sp. NPDC048505 TaxID=3155756 RepID=UPI0033D1F142